ncbi:MAG: hypothetical protein WBA17_01640 [Saprospiraceae bacterium]
MYRIGYFRRKQARFFFHIIDKGRKPPPAQKWLKDRRDRKLGFEDILHYQKIITALRETERLMQEIAGLE